MTPLSKGLFHHRRVMNLKFKLNRHPNGTKNEYQSISKHMKSICMYESDCIGLTTN